ncbi:outer membrane protein assembly factor BamE [Ottowia sp.]|uniref:outer membrane protein assembly factor BamE domain-containing protein n=1 Tax=Ottowia sp. TaxID=1898956 RepID=UPI0039E71FAC
MDMDGEAQDLGNDYSRSVEMGTFAHRYVLPCNPMRRLASAPQPVERAVRASRVRVGMTREQVTTALGYPIADETPNQDGRVWKYWRSRSERFDVVFNAQGRVAAVRSDDPALRARVTAR